LETALIVTFPRILVRFLVHDNIATAGLRIEYALTELVAEEPVSIICEGNSSCIEISAPDCLLQGLRLDGTNAHKGTLYM
jgi:hypothetical protein